MLTHFRFFASSCLLLSTVVFYQPTLAQESSQTLPSQNETKTEGFFSSPSFQLIDDGFAAYAAEGRVAAMDAWLKDSPLNSNQKQLEDQINNLANIERFYGNYLGYDYLQIVHLTTQTKLVYLIVNYESGPLFSRFVIYKSSKGNWVTTSFAFNTEIDYVVPEKFINNYLTPLKIN